MRRQNTRNRSLVQTINTTTTSNNNIVHNNANNFIDYDSIDETSTVLFVNYTGRARKLFRLVCYKLERISIQTMAQPHLSVANRNTSNNNQLYPSKHNLLARIHNAYVDILEYGMVSVSKNLRYEIFLKFETEASL